MENGKPVVTYHALTAKPIPLFEGLTQKGRRSEILRVGNERIDKLRQDRYDAGLGFLGARKVLAQVPGERPRSTNRSPKPPCFSKVASAIKEFKAANRELKRFYADASYEFRSGKLDTLFPEFTYKPPLHYQPKPLTSSTLQKNKSIFSTGP